MLRRGDANGIYFRTMSEVDRRLEFGRGERGAFPILLVLSDARPPVPQPGQQVAPQLDWPEDTLDADEAWAPVASLPSQEVALLEMSAPETCWTAGQWSKSDEYLVSPKR